MLNKIYNSIFFKPVYFLVRKSFILKEYFIRYKYKKADEPTITLTTLRDYNKNRAQGPEKLICLAPFKHMYFKQNGKVTACCASSIDAYGNINEDSIAAIWNGKNANELRSRIENYNLSGGCSGCQYSLETKNYNAFIGRIYDEFLPQKKSSYPTEMTFEISNTCNLECIMCNGEFSNLIRKNIEKLPDIPDYYNEYFFEEIKEFLPHLKRVRFMGGEPFLIKQYAPIMSFLVNKNPSCKIHIQTNGTILNNAVKQIIESKNVEISISIDSLQKETYEKIRKNANFEKVISNLNYFSERAKMFNQLININFCVMYDNWMEVPSIVKFCDKNKFTLNLIPVDYPRISSLRICKKKYLQNILKYSIENYFGISNFRLSSVYTDYLNYIRALIEAADLQELRKNELLALPYETLMLNANKLFYNMHYNSDINNNAYDINTIFDTINNLKAEDKKNILTRFIMDVENIKSEQVDKNKTFLEIKSKTILFFNNLKLELNQPDFL